MIYVDELFECKSRDQEAARVGRRHGHRWCHLWCDSGEEEKLHAFARRIGMRRAWFQNKRDFPHYDLVPSRRAAAVAAGAIECRLIDWLKGRLKPAGELARLREIVKGEGEEEYLDRPASGTFARLVEAQRIYLRKQGAK
jgi:hypothetical protein